MTELDRLCAAALLRVQHFINRSVGQHLRALRERANHELG